MCQDKLDACSNLYGKGTDGLEALLTFVRSVGSLKVSEDCEKYLTSYVQNICTKAGDTAHGFPYDCRLRPPGGYICNDETDSRFRTQCNNSVYNQIKNYAKENCTRPSLEAGQPLPPVVQTAVNRVLDNLKLSMEKLLHAECDRVKGRWITYPAAMSIIEPPVLTPSGGLRSEFEAIEQDPNFIKLKDLSSYAFWTSVTADFSWGVCVANSCDAEDAGMRYTDPNTGFTECCKRMEQRNDANTACVDIPIDVCTKLVSTSSSVTQDGNCKDIRDYDIPGGCISDLCRCVPTYWSRPSDSTSKCAKIECTSLTSIFSEDCKPLETFPANILGGCANKGCMCKPEFKTRYQSGETTCISVGCHPSTIVSNDCPTGSSPENTLGGCTQQFCKCPYNMLKYTYYCNPVNCPSGSSLVGPEPWDDRPEDFPWAEDLEELGGCNSIGTEGLEKECIQKYCRCNKNFKLYKETPTSDYTCKYIDLS